MGPSLRKNQPLRWAPAAAVLAGLALAACADVREAPSGDTGEHPAGWIDPTSADFHAKYLRKTGDHIEVCQQCHGTDFGGGGVGVACTTAGCHTQPGGPSFCGTCHGGAAGPRPATGAHAKHVAFCSECHVVPKHVGDEGHITGHVTVTFSGAALYGDAKPVFDAGNKTCTATYCHGDKPQTWHEDTGSTPCDTCHGNPPASHARWSRVAKPGTCSSCHPVPATDEAGGLATTQTSATHLDGSVELRAVIACNTCHGDGPSGAPPVALDGSTDPTDRGVGAHRAHLDPTLPGRIGHVADCTDCHTVPESVTDPGHTGPGPHATVTLVGGGTYDPATLTCVVGCHWSNDPGPKWTDTSGAPLACDACHGFPPLFTRTGAVHTAAQPVLSACQKCHPWSPTTHVNGVVDLVP